MFPCYFQIAADKFMDRCFKLEHDAIKLRVWAARRCCRTERMLLSRRETFRAHRTDRFLPHPFLQVSVDGQDNRHMKVVSLSALRTGRLYPQEIFVVLIPVKCWVNPKAMVWPGRFCQWKIPMMPSGIERATSRLAQPTAPPEQLKI